MTTSEQRSVERLEAVRRTMRIFGTATVLTALAWNIGAATAQDVVAVPLKANDVYSAESTESLNGQMVFKDPKSDKTERLKYRGERKTRYIERVLVSETADDDIPERVLRIVETLDSKRKLGDMDQVGFELRNEAKHVVLHRGEAFSKPFSLKGPLKQEEIHTLSHLVFVPALNGLLPKGPLKVGAQWTANKRAVAQLAGLVPLESGNLSCSVQNMNFNYNGTALVQIEFKGVLVGMSEEGRVSDDVGGSLYLDRKTGKIHSLTVEGVRTMYDDKQKAVGELDMTYTLAVRQKDPTPELDDKTAAEAAKDPTPVQTAVLYEFPPCAVKLVHPRTWLLASANGTQLTFLYGKTDNQLMMNFHKDDETPSVDAYHEEVAASMKREKFKNIEWTIPPKEQAKGEKGKADYRRIGRFEATAENTGNWRMRYWVWQKGRRGVTLGIYLQGNAANNGSLADDAYTILQNLTFTGDRNPFFVKGSPPPPKDGAKK
jgi:hypothetical protein